MLRWNVVAQESTYISLKFQKETNARKIPEDDHKQYAYLHSISSFNNSELALCCWINFLVFLEFQWLLLGSALGPWLATDSSYLLPNQYFTVKTQG